jgi:hypothetical protein
MDGLRRATALVAAATFGLLVSGCVHEGQDTAVGSNGTADMVVTETLSPLVFASSDVDGLTPAKFATQEAKSPLPGQDSVTVFTDSEGWKGIQVRCTFHSLAALDAAEIAKSGQSSGAGLFSSFSIVQHGSQWVLDAKVDVSAITSLGAVSSGMPETTEANSGITRANLAQVGIKIGISFRLPGQIVSDNATSVSGSVMSWDLLSQVNTLRAVTTTSSATAPTTTAPATVTTTTAPSAG